MLCAWISGLGAAMAWRQGQSYWDDLRSRVLAAVDGGMAVRAAASVFQASISCIHKALIGRRTTGETSVNPTRGHRPRKLTAAQEAALAVHVGAHSDMTPAAMQRWLEAGHGVRLSSGAMWTAIDRLWKTTTVVAALRRDGLTAHGLSGKIHASMETPLTEVDGAGPIALPLLWGQTEHLVAAAERVPYGRGPETVNDESVRRIKVSWFFMGAGCSGRWPGGTSKRSNGWRPPRWMLRAWPR